MKMKALGIDIGVHSVKCVELAQQKNSFQVTRVFEHLLDLNPAHDSSLEVLEFLQGLRSSIDLDRTQIVLSLPQRDLSSRRLKFPFTDRLKISQSLPFELEDEIPLNLEDALFESRILRQSKSQSEVFALAVPRNKVQDLYKLGQDVNLPIKILCPEGVALANLLENFNSSLPMETQESSLEGGGGPLEILLNLGYRHSVLSAFENRRLVASRSFSYGTSLLVSAISHKYEIPQIEAAKEFEQKAFFLLNKTGSTYEQSFFSDTLTHAWKEFFQELQRCILELETESQTICKEILITGGGSRIENLHAHLTQQLSRVVNRLQYPDILIFPQGQKLESKFALATGLALEAFRKPSNPSVNFFRKEFAPKNKKLEEFVSQWGDHLKWASAALAIFWIFALLRESQTLGLQESALEQLKKQARQSAGLSVKQANENAIQRYVKDQKKRSDEMKSLAQVLKIRTGLDLLLQVSNSLPSRDNLKIQVQELKIEGSLLSLSGQAQSPRDVQSLEESLKALSLGPLQKLSVPPGPGVGIPFAWSLQLDRGQRSR